MTASTAQPWPRTRTGAVAPAGVVVAAAALVVANVTHGPARVHAATAHTRPMDAAARAQLGALAGDVVGSRRVPLQFLAYDDSQQALAMLVERLGRGCVGGTAEVVDCPGPYSLRRAVGGLLASGPMSGVMLVCRPGARATRAGALS